MCVQLLPVTLLNVEADPQTYILMEYEKENKEAVATINRYGGDGNHLLMAAPKITAKQKNKIAVSVPQTRERQDALEKASTAGQKFYANAGGLTNCKDWFISQEQKDRKEGIQERKAFK